MGSCFGPMGGIWWKWSITHSESKPLFSAVAAAAQTALNMSESSTAG